MVNTRLHLEKALKIYNKKQCSANPHNNELDNTLCNIIREGNICTLFIDLFTERSIVYGFYRLLEFFNLHHR